MAVEPSFQGLKADTDNLRGGILMLKYSGAVRVAVYGVWSGGESAALNWKAEFVFFFF